MPIDQLISFNRNQVAVSLSAVRRMQRAPAIKLSGKNNNITNYEKSFLCITCNEQLFHICTK